MTWRSLVQTLKQHDNEHPHHLVKREREKRCTMMYTPVVPELCLFLSCLDTCIIASHQSIKPTIYMPKASIFSSKVFILNQTREERERERKHKWGRLFFLKILYTKTTTNRKWWNTVRLYESDRYVNPPLLHLNMHVRKYTEYHMGCSWGWD